ncbi:hypothetical protein L202_08399 [Cryptococcus amylolentus CBS 6039]|uniref:Uncharacterized protein n=2 Tax=Cryptococcus amylolentus TaxID=104669 RepID=A0A1E3HC27_9TREE|nr:hypothetical protein L202_08399 [Cryptococcus amylolentus CBS 6039]ODN73001.1 hypothetical protein L202_08399 [Cryptococcus amylolentus CBS 6039]ODN98158.1 hypothetical protein I350_07803 [Cryptococcus amylolentus CBS 6273]
MSSTLLRSRLARPSTSFSSARRVSVSRIPERAFSCSPVIQNPRKNRDPSLTTRRFTQSHLSSLPITPPPKPHASSSLAESSFHHSHFPFPPNVTHTSNLTEANRALSQLKGDTLGFDIQGPTFAVRHESDWESDRYTNTVVHDGVRDLHRPIVPESSIPKTTMVQVCDENNVVLINLQDSDALPSKLVDMVCNQYIVKVGINAPTKASKLFSDFPTSFPTTYSSGMPSSLLGLTNFVYPFAGAKNEQWLVKELCGKWLHMGWGEEAVKDEAGERDHASNTVYASFIISKMIGNAKTILDHLSMP